MTTWSVSFCLVTSCYIYVGVSAVWEPLWCHPLHWWIPTAAQTLPAVPLMPDHMPKQPLSLNCGTLCCFPLNSLWPKLATSDRQNRNLSGLGFKPSFWQQSKRAVMFLSWSSLASANVPFTPYEHVINDGANASQSRNCIVHLCLKNLWYRW